jgi:hypothetical protein
MDYTLVGQPASRRVTAGQSARFSLALAPSPADTAVERTIALTAAVVSGPAGGTAPTFTFDASSVALPGLVTMTASTSPGTLPGTYEVEVRGTTGAIVRRSQFRLEVAGFNLAAPGAVRVTMGGAASLTVDLEAVHGFSDTVALAVTSPLPAGVTASFSTPSRAAPGAMTLTLATTPAVTLGTSTVTRPRAVGSRAR